jgi:hypothetical protein
MLVRINTRIVVKTVTVAFAVAALVLAARSNGAADAAETSRVYRTAVTTAPQVTGSPGNPAVYAANARPVQ